MTFAQAIAYFLREATLSLVRSWKVSLLAILTIATSLFLAGVFLVVSTNLDAMIERWRAESKIVVYLEPEATAADRERLTELLSEPIWSRSVDWITSEEADKRFRAEHPSLSELLEGWGDDPLPASLEVTLDLEHLDEDLEPWLERVKADPSTSMIDDDRDTLRQLDAVVLVIRGLGLVLGTILLLTAVFTISSVIRLTAYLYRDEIAVMRLVGATEFFIRGPFYLEGFLQGLVGGVLAIVTLGGAYALWVEKSQDSALAAATAGRFLPPLELVALVSLGALAGLVGAVASLRKESLGQTAEQPDWSEE